MAKKPTSRSGARPTDKRAVARQRAAEMRAAEARRERKSKIAFRSALGAIGVLAIGGITWAVVSQSGGSSNKASGPLPTAAVNGSSTAMPPWPAPANAASLAKAAGLTTSAMEQTTNHFHTHLDVFVDGKAVPVPANLGIDQAAKSLSELHTHDASGVLHIESPSRRRYVLGQLFNEWAVHLDAQQIGGLKAGGGKTLTAYVNGKAVTGNPGAIELTAHREIALVFGSPTAKVKVPSSYKFPAGE